MLPPTTSAPAGSPHLSGVPVAEPDLQPRPTRVRDRLRRLHADDGMSTVEYAIGTLAAAAFAAVLYTVVSGDSIVSALTALVERALSVTF
ncbi:DUF4244 domain-containing protein [Pseudonocardia bannensis]|uniref:DUF4244 domain-containing protein n=1 Tax=Pseudonocardia bannensis TaxID=630973 RepID=A0A848DDM1_9PSEU|nr:DUF4244 domain-containing protein [Pseudonocardia bannensis]